MRPVENDILHEETNVNKENMASYADIVKDTGKEEFEKFRNCPIRIEIITGIHIFILFLPGVVTLCRHFAPRYRSR
jgi:hypothetical protein